MEQFTKLLYFVHTSKAKSYRLNFHREDISYRALNYTSSLYFRFLARSRLISLPVCFSIRKIFFARVYFLTPRELFSNQIRALDPADLSVSSV
jgi:hypothetical protein